MVSIIVAFCIGLLLGGTMGIFTLALLSINRDEEDILYDDEED